MRRHARDVGRINRGCIKKHPAKKTKTRMRKIGAIWIAAYLVKPIQYPSHSPCLALIMISLYIPSERDMMVSNFRMGDNENDVSKSNKKTVAIMFQAFSLS